MKIRVLGGGWYGCHLAAALMKHHKVELHEAAPMLFAGASGANPARLHDGFHYPRSWATRAACRANRAQFMEHYGHLTRGVPINIYAVAADDSLVDFQNYCQSLANEVEFLTVDAREFGLTNVEGAVQTGERHILINKAREHFSAELKDIAVYGQPAGHTDDPAWDLTLDCTFCANDAERIARFEPCLMVLMEGPSHIAVTIMDGPFGSLYPWDEEQNLCSLTSALLTPLSKECRSYSDAKAILKAWPLSDLMDRARAMVEQMSLFWPLINEYKIMDIRLSVRAMPRSGADARLVDIVRTGERTLRIRAGKIDAVFRAEELVRKAIRETLGYLSLVGVSSVEAVVPLVRR